MKSIFKKIYKKIYTSVLGLHPDNTLFSFNWHNVRHIKKFLTDFKISLTKSDLIFVDLGGGSCPYYRIFEDCSIRYIDIDVQNSLPSCETRNIEYKEGFAEDIRLDSRSVDVVICNQVLEHVLDPHKAINEVFRVLKSEGIFVGSVPHVSPIHLEPYDFWRFTELGIEKLLTEAGFKDIEIDSSGGVFSAAALMINMDLLMSTRENGKAQEFKSTLALFLSPLVGAVNFGCLILDTILGNRRRTPANLCWRAVKR